MHHNSAGLICAYMDSLAYANVRVGTTCVQYACVRSGAGE